MRIISALQEIWNGFDFTYIMDIIQSVIPALICITLHELSHGAAAYALGDTTAKRSGRLTLNPIKHIDLGGLVMMVVFRFGWAKPVPVNMFNFKNPKKGMAITALAGPVSNIIIAVVFLSFSYGLLYLNLASGIIGRYLLNMFIITARLSVGLGVFNLIPIPPLDGSKILFALLDDSRYYKLMRYERYGMILTVILIATGILSRPLNIAVSHVFTWLMPVAQFPVDLIYNIFS